MTSFLPKIGFRELLYLTICAAIIFGAFVHVLAATYPDSLIWYDQGPGRTANVSAVTDSSPTNFYGTDSPNCFGSVLNYGSCSKTYPDGSVTNCKQANYGGQSSCGLTLPDGSTVVENSGGGLATPTYTLTDQNHNQINLTTGQSIPATAPQGSAYNPNAGNSETPNGAQAAINAGNQAAQCVINNFWNCILSGLALFAFQISATILGFVGLIFNWVVTVSIFDFAIYFANNPGFLAAWDILRDIGNIVLLFGFIFMGLATILDIQSFPTRQAIPRLIIFAVLLNFSLFAAEAVVDTANALTASFYTQAGQSSNNCAVLNSNASLTTSTVQGSSGNCGTVGIAGVIVADAGLTSIWGAPPNASPLVLFLLAIFACITIWVLLAGAIMLFVRAVVLVLVLISSPIGFAGMALPPLQGMAQGWWNKLLSEAFFAPLFLLMIFVSLKITTSIGTNSSSFAAALSNPNTNNFGVFFIFVLVMIFMIASLIVSRKIGATGAEHAINFSTKVTTFVPGAVGRWGVGSASQGAQRGYNRWVGGLKSSNSRLVRGFGKTFDATIGEGIVGVTQAGKTAKIGGKSFEEDQKHRRERYVETTHASEVATLTREAKEGLRASAQAARGSAEFNKGKDQAQRALQKLAQGDLEKLLREGNSNQRALIAEFVSASKAKEIMGSKELSPNEKEKFMEARNHFAEEAVDTIKEAAAQLSSGAINHDQFRDIFKREKEKINLTNTDLDLILKHTPEFFEKLANVIDDPNLGGNGEALISSKLIDFAKDNEGATDIQRKLAKSLTRSEQLNKAVQNVAVNGVTAIENLMGNMGKELADASASTITHLEVINRMTAQHAAAIMAKNELNDKNQRQHIKNTILNNPNHPNFASLQTYFNRPNNRQWWG